MSSNKTISVIGGTGNLGVPVVKFLQEFGFGIKLIVRNLQKAMEIFGTAGDISFAEADLTDTQALRDALADTEYLYLNLSTQTVSLNEPFYAEREGIANILGALNPEKIKQILAISGLGAFGDIPAHSSFEFAPNIIRKQGHDLIKNSGIPYTILHCTWFADSFVIYRRKGTYAVIGDTRHPIYPTNCYNFARHLEKAIGNPGALSKEFPVQGHEGFTHPEAAGKFLAIFAPAAKVAPLPHGIIKMLALFKKEMKFIKHMSDYFRE